MTMRRPITLCLALFACGPQREPTISHGDASHADGGVAASVTPACLGARDARVKAAELDRGGHEALALAKLDEANAACADERATTAPLEKTLRDYLGPSSATSKGTDVTMRAKMHEADAAERAKDFARAKTLYEAAWAELHPNPRALEDAARMAALAGDAAESRRMRDRALAEATSAENAVARLTSRVRVTRGSPRLTETTLLLARDGKVVARDTKTGELRVMVDASGAATLSPHGTLAIVTPTLNTMDPLTVYDVLTGAKLFRVDRAASFAVSPDDTMVAVIGGAASGTSDTRARVFDVATGQVKSSATGKWSTNALAFGPDAAHLLVYGDDSDGVIRSYDLEKNAYAATRLDSSNAWATSNNGHYLAYLDDVADTGALHVRDLVANKEVAKWTAKFHSVQTLAISDDGKTVSTGSYSSLRLWDVEKKKQLFKHETGSRSEGVTDSVDAHDFSFSDDGKAMVLAGYGLATAWDVATGAEKALVTDDPEKNVLRVVPAPDGGVAVVAEEEVRIVPATGDPRVVCKGLPQRYYPIIGPTSVAFSATGKSFVCVMSDGWAHVLDTSTWTERAVIKRGAPSPITRPVDLAFSADEKTLTIVSNVGSIAYDASTGSETKRTTFRHPQSLGLAPRHGRFDDGSVAVRLWNGSAAIFDESGAWKRDVKLVAAAPVDALDAFASGGATYAVALGKTVHVVDLATGEDHTTDVASAPKSLAVSPDGKSVLVAAADGTVSTISGGAATPLASVKGTRVGFAGKSTIVWAAKDVLDELAPGAATPLELVLDASGLVVQNDAGAFEARGKPEVACVVGKTFLTLETCSDRAKDGLVGEWLRAAR